MIGKLLALPFRVLNVPARTVEKIVAKVDGQSDIPKCDRIISVPLDSVAEVLEELDDNDRRGEGGKDGG